MPRPRLHTLAIPTFTACISIYVYIYMSRTGPILLLFNLFLSVYLNHISEYLLWREGRGTLLMRHGGFSCRGLHLLLTSWAAS